MAKVGELKQGSYAIINDEPSQIVSIQKSKPGKHGSAKFRCTAISLFDGRKQSFVSSTDANIQIPIVDKRRGQVVSMGPTSLQLMDLETYDMMDIAIPTDEEIASKLEAGKDVEYWIIMDRVKIQRVKN
ncbi:translation initiation factor IF-5A [Candidatus Bathyarchaeota archaeon]|nr:translation initiation factor IF-5A [Candidatus Bathyarchaeota archaeon]MCK4400059.1 translation initiation factor IF-5A [Candidatus Bathyarchaeota archaeon]